MGSLLKIYLKSQGPLLNDRILQNLDIQTKGKTWDFNDFILPFFFGLGSIIYFLFAKQNATTTEHSVWFEIPQGSQAIAIVGSALSLLLLVLLDQFLQKKTGKNLGLFCSFVLIRQCWYRRAERRRHLPICLIISEYQPVVLQ